MTLSPFASAAPDLIRLGYHPLPILPANAAHGGKGKAPGEYTMGSWRGMLKWQSHRDTPASAFHLGLWTCYPGANIGLVLGSPIGALKLIAVDVDTTDPDELRDILGALPYSPMVKRGAKGETRFYAASKDITSTPYDKAAVGDGKPTRLVDLLTGFDARQTVVPPSVHPDGPVYAWTAGPVAAESLPVFTEDDKIVLEETLAGMGWLSPELRATRVKRPLASGNALDPDDFFTETKVRALADMDAWVFYLDVYDLRPARGGYEAVATWRPSSTGKPIPERKRNLSIQSSGIKDFGTNWTGSAIDLVMEAQDLDQAAATSWLRMRLGLTGEVMLLDQQPRAAAPASAFTADKPGAITEPAPTVCDAGYQLAPAPSSRTAPVSDSELPDALTRVPGLVGLITDWIVATAPRPQRGLALGAALTLVGTAAGRKFGGPTNSGTHLYVMALAPTGAGKDAPIQAISRILDASAMGAHQGAPQFMSMSSVVAQLRSNPQCLSAMDEFGSFLKRVNNKKAMGHEQAITGVLRTAWGCSFGSFMTPAWADRQSEKVIAPAMSIYGASTQQEFYSAIEGGDIFNGFLNRFLTISTAIKPAKCKPSADPFDVPSAITDAMIGIYQAGGALLGPTMHSGVANRPAITVPWECEQAERVYTRLDEDIDALEIETEMWSRTAEMALRMATIRAIGANHLNPRISVEDMEWGRDIAIWSAERMTGDADDFMSENDNQANTKKILKIIREGGRVTYRRIYDGTRGKLLRREIDALLGTLIDVGKISLETVRPTSGGHSTKFYSMVT